jgi:prophage DNA circulation protein
MKEVLKQALNALATGLDCAQEVAHDTHLKYAGYKPARHEAVDAAVKQIEDALESVRNEIEKAEKKPGDLFNFRFGVNQYVKAAIKQKHP